LQKGSIVAQLPAVSSGSPRPPSVGHTTTQGIASSVSPSGDDGPLRIPAPVWQRGSGIADSQLLRAEEALVPFDPARQPDLDALDEWLDDAQWREAVRLVTGAGGLGKTRLALELCRQRRDSGWAAGFLEHGLEPRDIPAAWTHLRGLSKPVMIAIDYAETRQAVLLALVKAMLQSPPLGAQPVRVLLLARDAGEWWDRLPSKDPVTEAFLDGYATSGPARLPSLHAATLDRRSAYAKALNAFATRLGIGKPTVMPDLTAEHFGRPLYLQMAALLALHGEQQASAEGLTKALLNHETRYWRGVLAPFAWAEPERQAAQLLALTTLAGGFATPREAQAYWATAGDNTLSSSDLAPLFHALAPLYAGRQGLQPVRPDLLGEALVAQALLRSEACQLLDAVLSQRASGPVRRHALTVLARLSSQRFDVHQIVVEALVRQFPHCVQDVMAVATASSGQLARLAEAAFARLKLQPKSQVAGLLGSRVAGDSVQLAGLYVLVSGHEVEKWRKKKEKKKLDSADLADYATALSNYAVRLRDVGRSEDALEHAQQALEIHRRLAQARPDRYDPDYATSLSNYATYLSDVGRSVDALEYAQQALEIRRRLAQARPDRYDPDYATSLSNYAGHSSEVGRSEDALEHAQQALEIRRRLAQARPDRYDPDYATSLSNYAVSLRDAGRNEDALEHAQQALEIRRRLAQVRPDRYDPHYARSLSNYASHLRDVGRSEDALEHAQQALEIHRRLAQARPDRYDPDYARSLSNYANHLSDAGRSEDALEHAQQALEIRRRLAQARPDRYDPDYATSLSNCASRLSDVGRSEDALEHAQQALEIHRRLAQARPDRYDPDYARSLSNYASHLSDVGRSEDALEHAQQALEIHRRLAQARPDRYDPDYATSLSNYASLLNNVGRSEDALEHAQQALEIYRRLSAKRPLRFEGDLFHSGCSVQFLSWLAYRLARDCVLPDPNALPETIPLHQRPVFLLHAAFVHACLALDEAARAEGFKRVVSAWSILPVAGRAVARDYWLCAAAWCEMSAPDSVARDDWHTEWRSFASRRQGQVPDWMLKVAQRLSFQWPV
jgi:tetratricopeptide (TPR) repeat protein